jgi:hypothetical protein
VADERQVIQIFGRKLAAIAIENQQHSYQAGRIHEWNCTAGIDWFVGVELANPEVIIVSLFENEFFSLFSKVRNERLKSVIQCHVAWLQRQRAGTGEDRESLRFIVPQQNEAADRTRQPAVD